jgi:hypothetical protein
MTPASTVPALLTLDDVLPAPHFRERHACHIAAAPQAVWDALQEVRLGDLALSRALMGVRLLPMKLAGKPAPRVMSGRFLDEGPLPVLASCAPRSVLAGAAIQPWKLTSGYEYPPLDAEGLRAFDEPGWAKTGADFILEAQDGGTQLTTETRITATDARSRALFGLYWGAIRVGSGLIRRDMLHALARRAEGTSSA